MVPITLKINPSSDYVMSTCFYDGYMIEVENYNYFNAHPLIISVSGSI